MAGQSAGILMYRRAEELEVLLVHPGGPFFVKKDLGSWSIPKGIYTSEEEPLAAAKREFHEETGMEIDGDFIPLAPIKLKSGKEVRAWAVEGDMDPQTIVSNTFDLEWPPRSGKKQTFPEVDRGEWFNLQIARQKINERQVAFLNEFEKISLHLKVFLLFLLSVPAFSQSPQAKMFLVCGDSKILLVDYAKSKDNAPEIIWSWDAHFAQDLPEVYRTKMFNTIDDCKAIENGDKLLVSSSSGAIAILDIRESKVLFYASVPNAHSIALLPDNRLVAAASTHINGNKIMLFDIAVPDKPLFTDSLYSAHGLVWNEKRNSLFALGYDVLREYKIVSKNSLRMRMQWKIPGIGGHELQPTADGENLFVTEHNSAWLFDLVHFQFKKIDQFPNGENIKSLGQNKSGQYIFTVPEESWWTFHVKFFNPARTIAFPDVHVYKARWF